MLSGFTVTIICAVLGLIFGSIPGLIIGVVVGMCFHVLRKITGVQ